MPELTAEQALAQWHTSQANRRLVEGAVAALNRQDFEHYFGLFAEDFEFHMPGTTPVSGSTRGMEAFTALVGKVVERLEGMIHLEVTNLITAGEWVVTESRGEAVTRDGRPYNNQYCHLWRVVNGRIVRFVEYNDSDLVRRVLFAEEA